MRWDDLTMSERAEVIKMAVKNKMYNLADIRNTYNKFAGGGPTSDADLVDWIIKEEGFIPKPTDIGDGMMTLGSGLTSSKWHDLYKKRGNKWSAEDNRMAVAEEVANRRRWAEKNVPNWDSLPESSQKALLSYKYNYDFNEKNSPKLYQALRDSNLQEAAKQMDATSKNVKFKSGLQSRRQREQEWFLSDVTPGLQENIIQPLSIPEEKPISTAVYNPFVTKVENTIAAPVMVPDFNEYITAHKFTEEEDAWNKANRGIKSFIDFNRLMDLLNFENMFKNAFIPKFSKGGHLYDGTTEDNQQINIVLPGQKGFKYSGPTYIGNGREYPDHTPKYHGIDLTYGLPIDTVRRRLYDNLLPVGYGDMPLESWYKYRSAVKKNKRKGNDKTRDDIWATYLQIPKSERHFKDRKFDKVVESNYRPTIGDDPSIDTYYKIDNPVFFYTKPDNDLWPYVFNDVYHYTTRHNKKQPALKIGENRLLPVNSDSEKRMGTLQQYFKDYTVGHGRDEKGEYISYYDKWDLSPITGYGKDVSDGIGKPVHFYDRKYLGDYYGLPEEDWRNTFLPEIVVIPKNK